MSKLVSVIVPVYNAEKYLSRCIKSILHQTYKNLELILVDDGSCDNSISICREYKNEDNRVKIIQQTNQGVSAARNNGFKESKGFYIMYIDSDDYLESNMIEKLINECNENVDMVICGYCVHNLELSENMNANIVDNVSNETQELNVDQIANNYWFFYRCGVINAVWNKIYKRSIIAQNNIEFPMEISMGEDGYHNVEYFMCSRKIKIINDRLYHYMVYPNQSSKKCNKRHIQMMISNFEIIEKFIRKYNGFSSNNLYKEHYKQFFMEILYAIKQICYDETLENTDKYRVIKELLEIEEVKSNLCKVKAERVRDAIYLHLIKKHRIKILFIIMNLIDKIKK